MSRGAGGEPPRPPAGRRRRRSIRLPAGAVRPGEAHIVRDGNRELGVFNVDGRYYAINNVCPHAGGPLCRGPVSGTTESVPGTRELAWVREGEILSCPWHGWEFDIRTGQTVSEPVVRARTYPVSVDAGDLVIEL